ncbi:MAG: hypothetical protein NT069_33440 [Planctomycetota bacterium]|nr:hypothetical protein [Planctomycetota bacterium]
MPVLNLFGAFSPLHHPHQSQYLSGDLLHLPQDVAGVCVTIGGR